MKDRGAQDLNRWKRAIAPASVLAWSLVVQLVYLRGEMLLDSPINPLFFGDGLHFLETARALAEGRAIGSGLPFHPPLTSWLLAPLWSFFAVPARVFVASKILMALLGASTHLGIYLLLQTRTAHALWICYLLPLTFPELLLGSVANSETVYRLLLVGILLLGSRLPLLAGALHGLATLTRAEHLLLGLALLIWRLTRPEWRRHAGLTLAAFLLVLAPWTLHAHRILDDYNREFASELVEELPSWVPVSFYGPLNFALAQKEPDIFFSRRTLPVPTDGSDSLDPTEPEHNAYVNHGYRIGLAAIFEDPVRFVGRTGRKLLFSLHGLAPGWSWREFPKSGPFVRYPIDLATASAPFYTLAFLALAALGLWTKRTDRALIAICLGLILYRLSINAVFFPYLRSMAIATPAVWILAAAGMERLFDRFTRPALIVLLLLVASYHLATGWRIRNYQLSGERDSQGRILDDREVTLKFVGFRSQP